MWRLLLALESFLHLHQTTLAALLIAASLRVGAIVLSVSTLVPYGQTVRRSFQSGNHLHFYRL